MFSLSCTIWSYFGIVPITWWAASILIVTWTLDLIAIIVGTKILFAFQFQKKIRLTLIHQVTFETGKEDGPKGWTVLRLFFVHFTLFWDNRPLEPGSCYSMDIFWLAGNRKNATWLFCGITMQVKCTNYIMQLDMEWA